LTQSIESEYHKNIEITDTDVTNFVIWP